jgi:hypothetical protein
MWRWDQGRLLYLQFDALKSIAEILVKFDGADIRACDPQLREALKNGTGLPFAPNRYTVLRNYKRMFECAFLATVAGGRLAVSDFAHELAKAGGSFANADDYLLNYIGRFRFPFAAFGNYNAIAKREYPFCATIKLLIAMHRAGKEPRISFDDAIEYISGNNCTGCEDIAFYSGLAPKPCNATNAEKRQRREMLIFISQLSMLKVYDGCLWLDVASESTIDELADKFLAPVATTPKSNRNEEFMSLTQISGGSPLLVAEALAPYVCDVEFIEGKRKRTEHFRVERSPLLRRCYMQEHKKPVCEMCGMKVSERYPWTEYMLDIHHLLPLSSSVAITAKGTSLNDIVGLCPSCHRSIHIYYAKWLRRMGQDDFLSRGEARDVYLSAIRRLPDEPL